MNPLFRLVEAEIATFAQRALCNGNAIVLSPERLLKRGASLVPRGRKSANGQCHMIAAKDGWIALNLARPADMALMPAWLETEYRMMSLAEIAEHCRPKPVADLRDQGIDLHLPISIVGEWKTHSNVSAEVNGSRRSTKCAQVLDASALWAGPLCGGLLALAGHNVTRLNSQTRPDPTAQTQPRLDQFLNGNKEQISGELGDAEFFARLARSDILITSGRPHALARRGLSMEAVFACQPHLIWITVTAYGWTGTGEMRIGFGDDCAAAAGLVTWHGEEPHFIGDALADPLTGLCAASAALEWLECGKSGILDISLADVAAGFARSMAGM